MRSVLYCLDLIFLQGRLEGIPYHLHFSVQLEIFARNLSNYQPKLINSSLIMSATGEEECKKAVTPLLPQGISTFYNKKYNRYIL